MVDVKLKPDQPVRRYLGIDVTGALDTVVWGHLWNATFGWENLVWELDKDAAYKTTQLRIDKAHPKMPIKRLVRKHRDTGFADTVLMPEGIDGKGSDASYSQAEMDAAGDFMHTFILSPGAEKTKSELNDSGKGVVADVVLLSSHGLLMGDSFGNGNPLKNLFMPSKSAAAGAQFSGPGWLLQANCSTLDPGTHGDWLALMSGSNPLRGITGFQHGCPTERGSADFLSSFIRRLARGTTLVDAWKEAVTAHVSAKNWVVLCHQDAVGDKIADWNSGKLKSIKAGSDVLFFDDANPTGTKVVPPVDPFEAFWSKGSTRITAVNKNDAANRLKKGDTVVITVRPPAPPPATPPPAPATFATGTVISITLVYIRVDYKQNIDVDKMFSVTTQSGAGPPTTEDLNPQSPGAKDSWKLTVTGTPTEVTLTLKCSDLSMLHDTAMPLWLRVDITSRKHDFIRNGAIIEEK
jgi:hypothetical protein